MTLTKPIGGLLAGPTSGVRPPGGVNRFEATISAGMTAADDNMREDDLDLGRRIRSCVCELLIDLKLIALCCCARSGTGRPRGGSRPIEAARGDSDRLRDSKAPLPALGDRWMEIMGGASTLGLRALITLFGETPAKTEVK